MSVRQYCGHEPQPRSSEEKSFAAFVEDSDKVVTCPECKGFGDIQTKAGSIICGFCLGRGTQPPPATDDKPPTDKERIDWLEQHYQSVNEENCRQTIKCGLLGVTFDAPHPNLRRAIDAKLIRERKEKYDARG